MHDSNNLMLESDKPSMVYQPPKLTRLEDCDIEGGADLGPETNDGFLS